MSMGRAPFCGATRRSPRRRRRSRKAISHLPDEKRGVIFFRFHQWHSNLPPNSHFPFFFHSFSPLPSTSHTPYSPQRAYKRHCASLHPCTPRYRHNFPIILSINKRNIGCLAGRRMANAAAVSWRCGPAPATCTLTPLREACGNTTEGS